MSLITNEKSKTKKGNDKSTKVPGSSSIFSIKYKLWGGFIVPTIFMIIIGMFLIKRQQMVWYLISIRQQYKLLAL